MAEKSIQNLAVVDGTVRDIKEFQHLAGKRNRPKNITCPIDHCGQTMVMVLPRTKRAHYRHKSKTTVDHSPESIWHFEAKHHIGSVLNSGKGIRLNWWCDSEKCKGSHQLPAMLKARLTHVDIDSKKIGRFLPDITIYNGSQPIGVIEVCNSHASTREKIAYYNKISLPWIEVIVNNQSAYDQVMSWGGGGGLESLISKHYQHKDTPKYCPTCDHIIKKINRRKAYKKSIADTAVAKLPALKYTAECSKDTCKEKHEFRPFEGKHKPHTYKIETCMDVGCSDYRYTDIALFNQDRDSVALVIIPQNNKMTSEEEETIRAIDYYTQHRQSQLVPLLATRNEEGAYNFTPAISLTEGYTCDKCQQAEAERQQALTEAKEKKRAEEHAKDEERRTRARREKENKLQAACEMLRTAKSSDEKQKWRTEIQNLRGAPPELSMAEKIRVQKDKIEARKRHERLRTYRQMDESGLGQSWY